MYLLIDIGNTRIKWMYLAQGDVISSRQLSHAFSHQQNFSTAIDACFGVGSNFQRQFLNIKISKLVVSNVAGDSAVKELTDFSVKQWKIKPYFVQVSKTLAGINNGYDDLSELGVDRCVAMIGARQYFPQGNIIVINCGTAITVDLLNEADCFKGGAILPGFELVSKALSHADGITRVEPSSIRKNFGTSTQECVKLGIVAACIGGVEFVVHKIQSDLGLSKANILLSGGAAELFLDASGLECEYDANVIMRGLNRVIECEF